jgi:membrane protease YdiL (CAAX protease family)
VNTSEEGAYTLGTLPAATTQSAAVEIPPDTIPFNPDNPPWGLLQALLAWFLSLVLMVCVQFVILLGYIPYLTSQHITPTEEFLRQDKTFLLLNVLGFFPIHLLTLVLAWVVVTQRGKFSFRSMIGWSWPSRREVWISIGLAILLFGAAAVLAALFGGQETELDRIVRSSRPTALVLAIVAVATAPLAEEIIFRGILYSALQRSIGVAAAIVIVASLFAGGHVYQYWPNIGVISAIVLLSLSLTLVRAYSGRLLPCFIIHLVFNGITSVGILLSPYVRGLDSGGQNNAAGFQVIFRSLQHLFS